MADLDSDGSIDGTRTDSTGHYLFHYVRPGDHQVVEYVPSGWEPLYPDGKISFSMELVRMYPILILGTNAFRLHLAPSIYLANKVRKITMSVRPVYDFADLNDNQSLDEGELSTQTMHDNPLTDQNEAGHQLSGFGDRTSVVIRELESQIGY